MSALRDALGDLSDDVFFDLLESDDAYLLVIDVAGVTADSLDLTVENGRLSVDAQREKDLPGEYQYVEENRPLFVDIELPLPEDASDDTVSVEVKRGVLEVTVPRRATETTIDVEPPARTRSEDADDEPDREKPR